MLNGRDVIKCIEGKFGSYTNIPLKKYVQMKNDSSINKHIGFYEDQEFLEFHKFLDEIFCEKLHKSIVVCILNNLYYYSKKNMLNIDSVIDELSNYKKLFHSEEDFRNSFIDILKVSFPGAKIADKCSKYKCTKKYIDIVIEMDNQIIPIELRYKTDKLNSQIDGENYALKKHGAHPQGRYDFTKDIESIEKSCKNISNCSTGYVIFLTNDSKYFEKILLKKNTCDFDFRISEGEILEKSLNWKNKPSPGTTKNRNEAINFSSKYVMKWRNYSYVDKEEFKILIIKID